MYYGLTGEIYLFSCSQAPSLGVVNIIQPLTLRMVSDNNFDLVNTLSV